jgi:hypothetical protein
MPQHAPCRNRTYNLVNTESAAEVLLRAVSDANDAEMLRSRFQKSRIRTQGATKVQPLRIRPSLAIRRGWMLPDDGPKGAA